MNVIEFNDVKYPIREVYIPTYGYRNISVIELQDIYFQSQTANTENKVELDQIDEEIFFYVTKEEIKLHPRLLSRIISRDLR